MNIYLEGFIRDENMRFRDHEIKFLSRPPPKAISKVAMTSWGAIDKKLENFHLHAHEGTIGRNQIIGILGENGIGKTTFVKILAGIITPDSGDVDTKIKVAYKPQYLEGASDVLVITLLKDAASKYKTQLIKPLEIDTLLLKPLNTLSGGELQRVAIAHCLSQPADLYLLDEPSAYLDIEQRLAFSKVIRDVAEQRGVSVLIVDHDLLFIDYLADKLIVFGGKPAHDGIVKGPFSMEQGMNEFLSDLKITMRRDKESNRPRINKPDSRLDKEQREAGKLYYT
jgi:ATP-binding cassette subfamily E protein 1